MTHIDQSLLMAYNDGELDTEASAEVEMALGASPTLRAELDALRRADAQVKAAFCSALSGPMPELALAPIASMRNPVKHSVWRDWLAPAHIAASIAVLAVGGFSGYMIAESNGKHEFAQQQLSQQMRSQALNDTLEKKVSGSQVDWGNSDIGSGTFVPVRTFRKPSGQYCREFKEAISVGSVLRKQRGIACRVDEGVWQEKVVYL